MNQDISVISEKISEQSLVINNIIREMGKVIVGQKSLLEKIVVAMMNSGHILLEGVPGLAKTLTVQTLSKVLDLKFSRVQFTPDLLPADLTGTLVFNPKDSDFYTKKGPVFTNLLLADEINRAPAKVQSALLEAMQERQVTIGEQSYKIEQPFLVMATQNPLEQQGTYPLPEAQVDRFFLKILVDYPSKDEEKEIMNRMAGQKTPKVQKVCSKEEIKELQETCNLVYVDEKIKDYIINLVMASREPQNFKLENLKQLITLGASPRASIALLEASKAHAFIRGRAYVTPEDVKSIGKDVLRHRITLSYEAEAEEMKSDDIINTLFDNILVP